MSSNQYRWDCLSGILWILYIGREKVASVSLMAQTGGYNARLEPQHKGCVLLPEKGTSFPSLQRAKAACEAAVKAERLVAA